MSRPIIPSMSVDREENNPERTSLEGFEELPRELEETFREFWTDNANRISLLYSGTGALKVDFTRTGKRSRAGEIEDGKRAVSRYFINNFYDVYNQNALDLVLGKIKHNDLNDIAKHSPTYTLGIAFAVEYLYNLDDDRPLLSVHLHSFVVWKDLQLELLYLFDRSQYLHGIFLCGHLLQETMG